MVQTASTEQQSCCPENISLAKNSGSLNDSVRRESRSDQLSREPSSRDQSLRFLSDERGSTCLSFESAGDSLAKFLGIIKDQTDKEKFHNAFFHDIREAYAKEGNHPKFWNTLQTLMSEHVKEMGADVNAFNKVFMNTVRDVYKQEGTESPAKFWKDLENRLYQDMRKEGELPTPPKPDDGGGDKPGPSPTDGSVKDARDKLHQALEGTMSGDRLARFDKMCSEFEKHAAERIEQQVAAGKDRATVEKDWNEKIKQTYANLTDMVTAGGANAPFDKAARANLAENAMYLFMNPSRENQGGHGTCWIESVINVVGLNNHPEQMSRLLKEVATTGEYTDTKGKHYTIPRQLLQMTGEESRWSIENAGNGTRSPAGAIFDRVLSYMDGRMDGGTNGGTPEAAQRLIEKATGERAMQIVNIRSNYLTDSDIARINSKENRQAMLEQGGVVLLGPGHMFAATLSKENGQWVIHGDNQWGDRNEQTIGVVSDLVAWNVQNTRQRYKPDDPVMLAQSNTTSDGRQIYAATRAGTATAQYDDTNPFIIVGGPTDPDDPAPHTVHYVHRRGRRSMHQFNEEKYLDNVNRMNRARARGH